MHCGISCARSYRTLRDGSLEGRFPRHFVPGYDQLVPTGQKKYYKQREVVRRNCKES